MGEGHILGIDIQSLEDGSLFVLRCVDGQELDPGRAGRAGAVRALLKEQLYKYTLAEALDGREKTAIHVLEQSLDPIVEANTWSTGILIHHTFRVI